MQIIGRLNYKIILLKFIMRNFLNKLNEMYDVIVFGAGINGCAITAEIATRGLQVLNVDFGNVAGWTSSNSTCLIHGGLRYLEQYDFAMVRKSLNERQALLNLAPHLVHPLPFVLPRNQEFPFWLARLGLLIYDNLSFKNKLSRSTHIKRAQQKDYFKPLKDDFNEGLIYYDGVTDDARLTITKALQAEEAGAQILLHTKLIKTQSKKGVWCLELDSKDYGFVQVKAKSIINATGSAVKDFAENHLQVSLINSISLVKGSHIILPKLYDGDYAYLLQNKDKRVIFVTPFHNHTMIGTTDIFCDGGNSSVNISEEEIDYLVDVASRYLKVKINKTEIISTRSGVRVLLASKGAKASNLSRDYALEFVLQPAPILHVIGGKLTVHSQLAEQAVEKLRPIFPIMAKSNRLSLNLPGATLTTNTGIMTFAEYVKYAKVKYNWLDENLLVRYLNNYGVRTEKFLSTCQSIADMGINFAKDYYQVEIEYLIREEFACDLHSLLWLHTKLGLIISEQDKQKLKKLYFKKDEYDQGL